MERLQKVIANAGYTSRRKAEDLIKKGLVTVNDIIVTDLGTKVSENDDIKIDGDVLVSEEKEYYLLYKPKGYVSTTKDEKGRKTVTSIIETNKRIYPIGRLDYNTTGIILLTNDGTLADMLMHPKSEIEKKYIAKVNGIVKGVDVKALCSGVIIDGKRTSPARVKLKSYNKKNNTSILSLTIHEGRNHQIKKMFEVLNYKVIKLKRESYANLTLEGLKEGEYRKLTPKEIKQLYNLSKKN